MLAGVRSVYDYYEDIEILVDDQIVVINSKDGIMDISEAGRITVRGMSTIIKVSIMITFYNQLSSVDVNLAKATDEFENSDFERFNRSIGQYMDSIELAMYR